MGYSLISVSNSIAGLRYSVMWISSVLFTLPDINKTPKAKAKIANTIATTNGTILASLAFCEIYEYIK